MLFVVWGGMAVAIFISMMTSSCTVSYQNIRTHGPVSDVDENVAPINKVNASASFMKKPSDVKGTVGQK